MSPDASTLRPSAESCPRISTYAEVIPFEASESAASPISDEAGPATVRTAVPGAPHATNCSAPEERETKPRNGGPDAASSLGRPGAPGVALDAVGGPPHPAAKTITTHVSKARRASGGAVPSDLRATILLDSTGTDPASRAEASGARVPVNAL